MARPGLPAPPEAGLEAGAGVADAAEAVSPAFFWARRRPARFRAEVSGSTRARSMAAPARSTGPDAVSCAFTAIFLPEALGVLVIGTASYFLAG
ncbi:hypothetical protein B7G68_04475 [Caulobacter segnis]|uniref:Uncharacterized protein n=1 Tax=Caulobacter segnis TaxID=88688 RepID=A0ABN5IQN9_9CAUL|nr:hypothetical protein B7G68_04475 [Caulobacter segnis]